ncbi:transposase, partial [Putridiphycobacter roseus]
FMKTFKDNGKKFKSSTTNKFWQSGNHAIELYSEKFVWEKINYIHKNPVVEGYVNEPEHWRYSSASNYIDGKGVLNEVICLPPMLRTVK